MKNMPISINSPVCTSIAEEGGGRRVLAIKSSQSVGGGLLLTSFTNPEYGKMSVLGFCSLVGNEMLRDSMMSLEEIGKLLIGQSQENVIHG